MLVVFAYSFLFLRASYGGDIQEVLELYDYGDMIMGFIPLLIPFLSLTLMAVLPSLYIWILSDYFDAQKHIDGIESHWRRRRKGSKNRVMLQIFWRVIMTPVTLFFVLSFLPVLGRMLFRLDPFQVAFLNYVIGINLLFFLYSSLKMAQKMVTKLAIVSPSKIVLILAFFVGAKFFNSLGKVVAERHEDKICMNSEVD